MVNIVDGFQFRNNPPPRPSALTASFKVLLRRVRRPLASKRPPALLSFFSLTCSIKRKAALSVSYTFFKPIFCENFEIAAVQKDANLVELEKCCRTHIFLQNFVLIQPRTSPPKICKILLILPILLPLTPKLFEVLQSLREAEFVALDLELTGLHAKSERFRAALCGVLTCVVVCS